MSQLTEAQALEVASKEVLQALHRHNPKADLQKAATVLGMVIGSVDALITEPHVFRKAVNAIAEGTIDKVPRRRFPGPDPVEALGAEEEQP